MLQYFILAGLFAYTNAGVGTLSAQENEQALQMFQRFCASGSPEATTGDTAIFCKLASGEAQENLDHNVDLPAPASGGGRQVLFIQPPKTNYNHRVTINGQAQMTQRPIIYVLPQRNTHNIVPNFNTPGPSRPMKPTVYFLNNNGASASSAGGNVGSSAGSISSGQIGGSNAGFVGSNQGGFVTSNQGGFANNNIQGGNQGSFNSGSNGFFSGGNGLGWGSGGGASNQAYGPPRFSRHARFFKFF